jgi:hypothetical protein
VANRNTLNIAIGFLNFGRPFNHIVDIISDLILFQKKFQIHIATNDTSKISDWNFFQDKQINIIDIDKSKSVAFGKNQLLKKFHDDGIDIGIIIEDDIIISDINILDEYIDLMVDYNVGTIFCGFCGQGNNVFQKPNPRIVVTVPNRTVMFNAMPDSGIQLFNLKINKELFNENLMYLEQKEYLIRLKSANLLPFLGVFLDIDKSYQSVKSDTTWKSVRPKNSIEMMIESQLLQKSGLKYDTTNNLDEVVKFATGVK